MKTLGLTDYVHTPVATIDDLGSIVLHVKRLPDPSLAPVGAIARLIDSQPGYASGNYYIRTADGEWKILPGDIEYNVSLNNTTVATTVKTGLVYDEVSVVANFTAVPAEQWTGTDYLSVNYLLGSNPPQQPDDGVVLCKIPGDMFTSFSYTFTGFIKHPCRDYSLSMFGMFANGSWFKIPVPTLS